MSQSASGESNKLGVRLSAYVLMSPDLENVG